MTSAPARPPIPTGRRQKSRWQVLLAQARPPAMESWERTAWIAAATQFVTLIGFGLSMPFLPLYLQELGVRDRAAVAIWSGVMVGSAAIAMAFVAPIWGGLADRYGRKLMLVRSMLGGAVLIAAMGFVADVWQLLGLRLGQGALTGSQAAAAALVSAATPANQAGYALGLISTSVQIGNSVGPVLGGLSVAVLGFRGSFILGGVMLLIGGLMAVFWVSEPPRSQRPISRTTDAVGSNWLMRMLRPFTWRGFRWLLVLQLGTQFVFSASVGLLPIYLQEVDRPVWLTPELASGLAITLTAVTAAVVSPFLGRWTDRHGPRELLMLSLAGSALVLIVQAFVPTAMLLLALRAVFGIWVAGVTATMSVMTKLRSPIGREGAAWGATASAQAMGWGLGPILGSGFVAIGGIPLLFVVCAIVLIVLAWQVMIR
jgi:DHA1 family multidrug resistance protein-like MFS transporter